MGLNTTIYFFLSHVFYGIFYLFIVWLVVSLISAVATSLVAIFSKIGLKDVNSNFATFFRTAIVIVFSIVLCLISGSIYELPNLTIYNWIYLLISGIFTGCSWLCYFKAISLGNINKVALLINQVLF